MGLYEKMDLHKQFSVIGSSTSKKGTFIGVLQLKLDLFM